MSWPKRLADAFQIKDGAKEKLRDERLSLLDVALPAALPIKVT
jgi:hypothetical protein